MILRTAGVGQTGGKKIVIAGWGNSLRSRTRNTLGAGALAGELMVGRYQPSSWQVLVQGLFHAHGVNKEGNQKADDRHENEPHGNRKNIGNKFTLDFHR